MILEVTSVKVLVSFLRYERRSDNAHFDGNIIHTYYCIKVFCTNCKMGTTEYITACVHAASSHSVHYLIKFFVKHL